MLDTAMPAESAGRGALEGLRRGASAALASMLFAGGAWLAWHHPLSPGVALGLYAVWVVVSLRFPGLWLWALPAALPLASLAPWTGWQVVDEFDLLVAASLAAGHARAAASSEPRAGRGATWLTLVVVVSACVGVARGLADAGAPVTSLYQGHADAGNTLRLVKPLVYGVLAWPLVVRCFHDRVASASAFARFAWGMWCGMGVVSIATLLERLAFTSLLDFHRPYRTVALFWEMNVGGAAIDTYMAMGVPFVAWGVWSARGMTRWTLAAAMALATEYACLTTFSRGVYLAVLIPLVGLMAWLLRPRQGPRTLDPWRARTASNLALLATMSALAAAVLQGDAFMMSRIAQVGGDYRDRLTHWRHGLDQIRDPSDWWVGIGLGRLPSHYAASAEGGEFSGRAELVAGVANRVVRLHGPATLARLGGLYALTQRLPDDSAMPLNARVEARASRSARLLIKVCRSHLLYEQECRSAVVWVPSAGTAVGPATAASALSARLEGAPPSARRWHALPDRVYSVSVLDAGAVVDLQRLSLTNADGVELLRHVDFDMGLGGWWPSAKTHFLPWHIDNLYLELLIERGLLGLFVVLGFVGAAAWRLTVGVASRSTIAAFLLASLAGVMLLGGVSSVMDVPRVAFGFVLTVLVSLAMKSE